MFNQWFVPYCLYPVQKKIFLRWKLPRVLLRELSDYPGRTSKQSHSRTFSLIKRKSVNKRQHNHIKFDFDKITILLKTHVYLRLEVSASLVQTHILRCKLGVKVESGTVVFHWGTGMWTGHFRDTSDTRNPQQGAVHAEAKDLLEET